MRLVCAAESGHRLAPMVGALADLPAGTALAHRMAADRGLLMLALAVLCDTARCIHGARAVDAALELVLTRFRGGVLFAKVAAWCRCDYPMNYIGLATMKTD